MAKSILPPFPAVDLTGLIFGRLKVEEYQGQGRWRCLCNCGKSMTTLGKSLRRGVTKSCGCYKLDVIRRPRTPNGFSRKEWRDARMEAGLCPDCSQGRLRGGQRRCAACRAKSRQKDRQKYKNQIQESVCHVCGKKARKGAVACNGCLERNAQTKRQERLAIRRKVIEAYGAKCNCCGERTFEFLTLDHVNNDGAIHRKTIGHSGNIYRWAIKKNFPDLLQVMCMNCNWAKAIHGECPHRRKGDSEPESCKQ